MATSYKNSFSAVSLMLKDNMMVHGYECHLCIILEISSTIRHIKFCLSISGSSSPKLHCGNVDNMCYWILCRSENVLNIRIFDRTDRVC